MSDLIEELGRPGMGVIESLFSPNIVAEDWMSPGEPFSCSAKELNQQLIEPIREAFPGVVFKVNRALCAGQDLIICGFFEGVFSGDYFGFTAHGNPCRWEARDIYRFEGGEISHIWWANDTLTVARQLGAKIEDDRLW